MSGANTPRSATPDPKEAMEPTDFASHPQEAYDFVCSVLEESIAAKGKYKAKYARSNAQNKKLHSIFHEKIEQIEALEGTVSTGNTENGIMGVRDKSASKIPPYNGMEGCSSAELWLDNLEKLQGVRRLMIRHWRLVSWLFQVLLVPGESMRRKITNHRTLTSRCLKRPFWTYFPSKLLP